VVGGLLDPGRTLAETCHVVEPEAGQRKLGECSGAVLTVKPLSGGGEKLDGVWHRTGVLFEHPECEQGMAANSDPEPPAAVAYGAQYRTD